MATTSKISFFTYFLSKKRQLTFQKDDKSALDTAKTILGRYAETFNKSDITKLVKDFYFDTAKLMTPGKSGLVGGSTEEIKKYLGRFKILKNHRILKL